MDGGPERDPLAEVNDIIREQGSRANESTEWLALESNPDVINTFCDRIGLPGEWRFVDVLGLDEELLQPPFVPKHVVACVLLFPCTARIYSARRRQDALLRLSMRKSEEADEGTPAVVQVSPEDMFFVRQVPAFGNACGTIACLHAVANSRPWFDLEADAPLEDFVQRHTDATPEERGNALLVEPDLKGASDGAAVGPDAQTACPPRDGPALDHHFASFVRTPAGRLVELDGTKRGPVDHGPTTSGSFLLDAACVMRREFIDVDPEQNGFAFMALAFAGEEPEGADEGDAPEG